MKRVVGEWLGRRVRCEGALPFVLDVTGEAVV